MTLTSNIKTDFFLASFTVCMSSVYISSWQYTVSWYNQNSEKKLHFISRNFKGTGWLFLRILLSLLETVHPLLLFLLYFFRTSTGFCDDDSTFLYKPQILLWRSRVNVTYRTVEHGFSARYLRCICICWIFISYYLIIVMVYNVSYVFSLQQPMWMALYSLIVLMCR